MHADGREALFWGDMLHHHPELVGELPRRDTIALLWHYEAPDPPLPEAVRAGLAGYGIGGALLRGFAGQVEAFAERAIPFWVCPGTSSWNSLVGRLANARANLRDAADVGLAHGATGYLLTDWGDNGHLQPPSVSFAPLLDAAGLAWNAERHRDADLAQRLDALLFQDDARALGARVRGDGRPLRADRPRGLERERAARGAAREQRARRDGDARRARCGGDRGVDRGPRCRTSAARGRRCADGEIVVRELAQALRLARIGAWRLARRAGARTPEDAALRAELVAAIEEQRACWLARARPGGLDDSVARLEKTLAGDPR